MRAKVDKLVEQEMRKRPSQSKRDYASHFPSNFELFKESPILGTEYQRVQQGKPITEMDTSRYKLIEPDDKEDGRKQIQKFGANAWKLHNYQLEHELQQLQRTLEDYRQKILELNKQRKAEQIQAGSQIKALENKWTELIGQTLQLEMACASLETEIQQLKQYEQQLINDTAKQHEQQQSIDDSDK
ncbi:breast carcinoma amplified sequence 2-domain-containing protein [Gigaspora rosea]|uniref:Breast carcinoma amplified sequence 2-domain-containing protein n=1 Tax=Gigaspora rosea TaxID=44941 RepID=A0A397U5K9_9GLOM|nr:breast carcinoma amplified sequence 2-domain-containing protein [Gigaspora rosea]